MLSFVNRQSLRKEQQMDDYQSLPHTRWECKYHVVLVPKCRRQVLYGQIKEDLGSQLAELARQRESRIETGSFSRITCIW